MKEYSFSLDNECLLNGFKKKSVPVKTRGTSMHRPLVSDCRHTSLPFPAYFFFSLRVSSIESLYWTVSKSHPKNITCILDFIHPHFCFHNSHSLIQLLLLMM